MIKIWLSVTSHALEPPPPVTNCHTFSDPLPLEHDVLYGRPLTRRKWLRYLFFCIKFISVSDFCFVISDLRPKVINRGVHPQSQWCIFPYFRFPPLFRICQSRSISVDIGRPLDVASFELRRQNWTKFFHSVERSYSELVWTILDIVLSGLIFNDGVLILLPIPSKLPWQLTAVILTC